jgi:hypothetical protein
MVDQACSQVFHNRLPNTQALIVRLRPFKSRREEEGSTGWAVIHSRVAKPEETFDSLAGAGFTLQKMRTEGGDLGLQ